MIAGEPVSVAVDSTDSTLALSRLSPGSSYEVSVISTLGLDESDPINDVVITREAAPSFKSISERLIALLVITPHLMIFIAVLLQFFSNCIFRSPSLLLKFTF